MTLVLLTVGGRPHESGEGGERVPVPRVGLDADAAPGTRRYYGDRWPP